MRAGLVCISCLALLLLATPAGARASAIAYDSAGDSAYNGVSTYNGINGGYGWGGPWIAAGSDAYLGSSSTNGAGDPAGTGDINSPGTPSGRAWGLAGSPSPLYAIVAYRPFDGVLAPGQTFSIDFDNGTPSNDRGTWVTLTRDLVPFSAGSAGLATTAIPSDATDYLVESSVRSIDTGVPVTDRGVHIEYAVLGEGNARLTLTSLAPGGASASLLVGDGQFNGVGILNEFGNSYDLVSPASTYFNNISITPEPGSGGLLIVCAGVLLARRRTTACLPRDWRDISSSDRCDGGRAPAAHISE